MPMYYYACECGAKVRLLRTVAQQHDVVVCKGVTCGKFMKRNPQGASSKIVETRDNGLMSKRIEQPADVERLNWERAHIPDDKFRKP